MFTSKESASKFAIVSVSLLILLKAIASTITGSISIRADAIHSVIDLCGVIIGYVGIKISGKPPDEDHAFGHGKAESIACGVIGALIFIAAGTIFYESVQRLITGATVEMVTVGIYITIAAIVINLFASWFALKIARANDSLALEATGRDLQADVLSSIAVLVGLILVRLTGLTILDPIVALLVAILILRTAYLTMRKAFGGLMDTRLPEGEEETIMSCITEYSGQVAGFHEIRTRKAGNQRFIDFHLLLPKDISVDDAHQMCDQLENDIENKLSNSNVTVHVEPCGEEDCDQCLVLSCGLRKEEPST
ncbi:cation diffusion facilitator family transporter [Chloroflexota bacterium]